MPKELLPVVDTPGIEIVAAEAAEAGAEQLLIVTSPGKDAVAAHFADSSELEKDARRPAARRSWSRRCAGPTS